MMPRIPPVTPSTAALVLDLVAAAKARSSAPLEWLAGFCSARAAERVAASEPQPRDTAPSPSGREGCSLSA